MIKLAAHCQVFVLTLLLFANPVFTSADTNVQQPARDFGYTIGDILVQRITGFSPASTDSQFAQAQRISAYLVRLPIRYDNVDSTGGESMQLRYQIINAPIHTRLTAIPALQLEGADGTLLDIPEWSFSISPLLVDASDAEPGTQMKPDRTAQSVITPHAVSSLTHSLLVLAATLLLWLFWWLYRQFSDRRVLPFAKAQKAIKRLDRSDDQSWITLHHAFNDTAGKSINPSTIDELFIAAPWLASVRPAIEKFYQLSAIRFFQQDRGQQVQDADMDVDQLIHKLYRLEKSHSSGGR